MKRRLLVLLLWVMCWTLGKAQLPPGSIAPDFTVTDINGQSHNLYNLLNQGKTVYLDFFATWCGPCWNYHNGHALRTIWETYGPDGTDEAFVIAIEGDPATNVPCIYGPSGCNNTTQGDWTAGTPYPIADDAGVRGMYSVAYYPTIYMVCPGTNKVYETGQLSATGLWNRRTQYCALNAAVEVASIQNVTCFGANTGKITVTSSGAIGPYTYQWSTGATTSTPVLSNIPAGTYACTVTPAQGSTGTLTDIVVEGPPSAIAATLIESTSPGCNNVPGSMVIEASGGWPGDYLYNWNNGQSSPELINISAGTYTVTITDDGGCTKTQSFALAPTPPMVISIAPPATITCSQANITINASASSSGNGISYNWFPSNGGVIVSGANTLTPVVSAAGTYTLQITNAQTTCVLFGNTSVGNNLVPPTAAAGATASINCNQATATLQGSGSTGANFAYTWTASAGGNITAGGNTLTPTVNAAGTYTLMVTNTTNGCTSTSTTTVTGNNTALAATATGGAITCSTTNVTLNVAGVTGSATYAWTGPNSFSSSAANPIVSDLGNYTVLVTDATGCSGTAVATVSANNATPGATATGGAITCTNNTITLNGSSATANVNYAWTGPNNFTAAVANPSVTGTGDYQLVVTNPANGCTSTATTTVLANNTAPAAAIAAPGNLNCNNAQIQLNATSSAQGAGVNYTWTTTNGNIVSGANSVTPLIGAPGTYVILVSNTQNGCTNTASVNVNQSTPVTATASATAVSCNGANNGSATAVSGGGTGNYTYVWSNGAATSTVTGLSAGQYGVVITDTEGCTATSSVEVTQPVALSTNASATAQTANGVNDGTATANPSGGTATYTYLWSNSASTASISNLAPGNYTVVITDANGCTAAQVVTVNSFNCALAASVVTVNVACANGNNGSAMVSLTGANNPVTYTWSNGATGATAENLAAGNYTVAILDANNCPAQLTIVVTEPAPLQANVTSTNETASGANDGTASAAPIGGTGTYTYTWSNGANTATLSNLAPGTYTVTVLDQNNCSTVRSITISSFDCSISNTILVTNLSCFGVSNGSITSVLIGGTAPFSYAWSNGATTAAISGIPAGEYTVSVTDANGCNTITTALVTQPSVLNATVVSTTNTICPNDATGAITTDITGGTAGYTYLWNTGATTANINGVTAGNYTLAVTDQNGCTAATSATISSNDTEAPSIAFAQPSVALDANGSVTVNPSMLNIVATDNCGAATVSAPATTYTCADLGTQTIMVTATDLAGNTTTALVSINVVDNIAPQLVCPQNIVTCATDNTVAYNAPVASDNCLAGGTWNLLAGLPSNSVFPIGTVTTQTYSYTDLSGNSGQCSFDISVLEAIQVSAVIVGATNNQATGSIDLTPSGGTAPYTYLWSNGATTQDLSDLVPGDYSVQVTDANGCKVTPSGEPLVYNVANIVNVQEPTWLSGMTVQPNPTTGLTNLVFGQLPTETVRIQLLDISGRLMFARMLEGKINAELDCSQMPEGMYLIHIQTGTVSSVRKLVVQR